MSSKLLKCIVVPPSSGAAPTATVIFGHGLGDTSMGWYDVAQMLGRRQNLRHVRFILPQAPTKPVSLNMGMPMPSWFDITSLEDVVGAEDEPGLLESAGEFKKFVAAEVEGSGPDLPSGVKIPASRVVVGGFSQGGAIALLAGLTNPEKVAGIISLSSWLPLRNKLKPPLLSSFASNVPIFIAGGTADPVVRPDFTEKSAKFLRAGADGGNGIGCGEAQTAQDGLQRGVTFKTYPGMAHSACIEEIEDLGAWLEKVIPVTN